EIRERLREGDRYCQAGPFDPCGGLRSPELRAAGRCATRVEENRRHSFAWAAGLRGMRCGPQRNVIHGGAPIDRCLAAAALKVYACRRDPHLCADALSAVKD